MKYVELSIKYKNFNDTILDIIVSNRQRMFSDRIKNKRRKIR